VPLFGLTDPNSVAIDARQAAINRHGLFINDNPRLTEWLVASGALHDPFVAADVGVQGGESAHWNALGDHLVVHGEDAEREFYFKPGNPPTAPSTRHFTSRPIPPSKPARC
jgi:hypothetical protein